MESRVEFEIGGWVDQQDDDDITFQSKVRMYLSGNHRKHSLSLPNLKQAGTWRKTRHTSSDLGISISPEQALPKKQLKKKEVAYTVESLLSCLSGLDYLDRINGDQVKLDDTFRSKYVLFFALKMPEALDNFDDFFPVVPLLDVCSELYRLRDDFEMVVAIKDYVSDDEEMYFKKLFLHFSHFSLFVPFEHPKIRTSLCDYLGVDAPGNDPGYDKCILVKANENILHYGSSAAQYLQGLFPVRPEEFLTFFNRLIISTWPVVSSEARYLGLGLREGTCPISNSMKHVLPEYPQDINKMVSELQKSCPIEIGQCFDVISLLSGNGVLTYLDRKDGDPVVVKEDTFIGKYIMVCCFHVPIFRDCYAAAQVQRLVNTCFDLYSTRNDFEMVVVVKMSYKADYEAVFDHFLSGFPPSCLVVPYKESKHRDFICKYLDLVDGSSITCLISDADVNRSVLHNGAPNFLSLYGADAFPFTEEKCIEVYHKSFWTSPSTSSLEGLLGCDSSYVLEDGEKGKITISELNKKVVALYMCVDGDFTSTLNKVHQQCIEKQLPFEIVLVYLPIKDCFDPQVYKGNIDRLLKKKKISWWRLPVNNNVSLKFKRLMDSPDDFKLIIVGPDNGYVDRYGGEILLSFGIDGYPFTRESLVQKELKQLRELTLESLLVIGSKNNYYVYKGNLTFPLAHLQGKNVLVYFASFEGSKDLYYQLLRWYPEIQADVDDFEVVVVRLEDEIAAAYDDLEVAECLKPWYVCPYDPHHTAILRKKIFRGAREDDTLVKFGRNGMMCCFRAQDHLSIHGSKAFREFGDPHLRQDVIHELKHTYDWFMRNME